MSFVSTLRISSFASAIMPPLVSLTIPTTVAVGFWAFRTNAAHSASTAVNAAAGKHFRNLMTDIVPSSLLHVNRRRPGDLTFAIRLGAAESLDYAYVVVGHLPLGARPDSCLRRIPVGHLIGGCHTGVAKLLVVAVTEFDV